MIHRFIALSAVALALTACGQKQTESVHVDPIYDKIGNATCPGGYRLATSDEGEMICAPL